LTTVLRLLDPIGGPPSPVLHHWHLCTLIVNNTSLQVDSRFTAASLHALSRRRLTACAGWQSVQVPE